MKVPKDCLHNSYIHPVKYRKKNLIGKMWTSEMRSVVTAVQKSCTNPQKQTSVSAHTMHGQTPKLVY